MLITILSILGVGATFMVGALYGLAIGFGEGYNAGIQDEHNKRKQRNK